MAAQRRDRTWPLLWKNKWVIAAITLLVAGTTGFLSKTQTPVYASTATLVVNQPKSEGSLDVARANEFFARTLVRLVKSVNVAEAVVADPRIADKELTPRQALGKMDFAQVSETQLLEVTAEDTSAAFAQELAQVWSEVFVSYAATELTKAAPGASVSVADDASLPPQPVRPKPTLYTAVAFILGLAAALAFVLIRDRLDTRIRGVDDLAEEFGLPVLASVPKKGKSANAAERFDESIRVLRTSLQFATEMPLRAIAVTSSSEGEGKSTVTAELARSFALLALTDQAVLAVDADLRRPTLHLKAGFDDSARGPRGLTSYLLGEARFEACVLETELASLRVMPAGQLHPNPSTMLGFAASREALGNLRQRAEVVIVDTPPVAVGADASIVATEMDGVVIVVDLAKSRRDDIRTSLEQMRRVNALVLGFVANRVPTTDRQAAGYYYTATDTAQGGSAGRFRRRGKADLLPEVQGGDRSGGASRPLTSGNVVVPPSGGGRDSGQDEERGLDDLDLVLRDRQALDGVPEERRAQTYGDAVAGTPSPTDFHYYVAGDPTEPEQVRREPEQP
jgi:capsular exopolysaccharide synthesis family protein